MRSPRSWLLRRSSLNFDEAVQGNFRGAPLTSKLYPFWRLRPTPYPIICNKGFETGDFTCWVVSNPLKVDINDTEKRSGFYCCHVDGNYSIEWVEQTFSPKPYKWQFKQLSLWAKQLSLFPDLRIGVSLFWHPNGPAGSTQYVAVNHIYTYVDVMKLVLWSLVPTNAILDKIQVADIDYGMAGGVAYFVDDFEVLI